jgi:hypothetical protein
MDEEDILRLTSKDIKLMADLDAEEIRTGKDEDKTDEDRAFEERLLKKLKEKTKD